MSFTLFRGWGQLGASMSGLHMDCIARKNMISAMPPPTRPLVSYLEEFCNFLMNLRQADRFKEQNQEAKMSDGTCRMNLIKISCLFRMPVKYELLTPPRC